MKIAQISDTHICLNTQDSESKLLDFKRVAESINALNPLPDLVVHTGDIVHNGLPEEYSAATSILETIDTPVCALVGNKDDRSHMREAFAGFGFLNPEAEFVHYKIDKFPLGIIALDTLSPGDNKGEFCEERIETLRLFLDQNSTEKPILIFMHHPPVEILVGPEPVHFRDPASMFRLQELLKHDTNTIVAISCGHVHREAVTAVGDIPVNVMSAVATRLRRGEYPDQMTNRPTYQIHTYDEKHGLITQTVIA